jgi:hypothetical protein
VIVSGYVKSYRGEGLSLRLSLPMLPDLTIDQYASNEIF